MYAELGQMLFFVFAFALHSFEDHQADSYDQKNKYEDYEELDRSRKESNKGDQLFQKRDQ